MKKKSTRRQASADLLGYTENKPNCKPKKPRNFIGTDNPRHRRVIFALLKRPIKRETLDSFAGASNGPDLVSDLRDKGLQIPCTRIDGFDRDFEPIKYGVYSLTARDRKQIHRWLASTKKVAA
jgi:hypothetical protein